MRVKSSRSWTMVQMASLMSFLWTSQVYASIENPSILPTPPMGFNNWARFECNLNQSLFIETADALVDKGLLAAGYNRINLDDCWMQTERASDGSLQWNTTLFPKGLVWLGEYVKSKGFHFGIYEDSGNETCGGYPGSREHEQQDAETFEKWGIDYLKLDGCNVYPFEEQTYQDLYSKWHRILASLDKPMIFSESAPAYFSAIDNNTDWYEVMDWVPFYGELARHSTDIAVYGLYQPGHYWKSIMVNYHFEVLLARYQQPGYYNDPDFIIPDWPELTLDEKKSHFALWCSFSAPLIISAYVPDLTDAEVGYLTNKDIIAIDQDPLALQATLVSSGTHFDVLTKSLSNGDRVLTVLNRGDNTKSTTVTTERMGLKKGGTYTVKDLWTRKSSKITGSIDISLRGHATAIYRISGCSSVIPTGMIFNTASRNCMTAAGSYIKFTDCDASEEQVWQVSLSGSISPLASPHSCLESSGGRASLGHCNPHKANSRWVYHVTGNVINAATGECLQVNDGHVGKCGEERDRQVFGLPSGVKVVRAGKV